MKKKSFFEIGGNSDGKRITGTLHAYFRNGTALYAERTNCISFHTMDLRSSTVSFPSGEVAFVHSESVEPVADYSGQNICHQKTSSSISIALHTASTLPNRGYKKGGKEIVFQSNYFCLPTNKVFRSGHDSTKKNRSKTCFGFLADNDTFFIGDLEFVDPIFASDTNPRRYRPSGLGFLATKNGNLTFGEFVEGNLIQKLEPSRHQPDLSVIVASNSSDNANHQNTKPRHTEAANTVTTSSPSDASMEAKSAKSYDGAYLCKLATERQPNGSKIWAKAIGRSPYINEAKRRGLTCSVGQSKPTQIAINSPTNAELEAAQKRAAELEKQLALLQAKKNLISAK